MYGRLAEGSLRAARAARERPRPPRVVDPPDRRLADPLTVPEAPAEAFIAMVFGCLSTPGRHAALGPGRIARQTCRTRVEVAGSLLRDVPPIAGRPIDE